MTASRDDAPLSPAASYTVRIIGGTIGGEPSPGAARLESVNLCPP